MHSRKANNRPVQILLVEDSPSDAVLMREVLRETDSLKQLSVVKDGVEALKFLRQEKPYQEAPLPDLILLDLNLPKLDGKELLQEIKIDPVLRLIPVVVLTTSAATMDILKSYTYHANCYIIKPLELDEFIRIVQSIENFWIGAVTLPSESIYQRKPDIY